MYRCAKCGGYVEIADGEVRRDCDCNEGVIANASATVTAHATVAGDDTDDE